MIFCHQNWFTYVYPTFSLKIPFLGHMMPQIIATLLPHIYSTFSLETPFLGHMMSQIIATLLPLLNSLPKQVAELFNFMIVENR